MRVGMKRGEALEEGGRKNRRLTNSNCFRRGNPTQQFAAALTVEGDVRRPAPRKVDSTIAW